MKDYYQAAPSRPINWTLIIIVVFLTVVTLSTVALYFGWNAIVSLGVREDLREYHLVIKECEMDETARAELLAQITNLLAQINKKSIDFLVWIDSDEVIRETFTDGIIDEIEVETLKSEFQRLETALK